LGPVFQPLRTAISLAVLAGALWAAFTIDLGGRTFSEHVDTISETPEAKQLVDDTRATVNPALQDVRDRVLGEYVEAPTWIPEQESVAKAPSSAVQKREAKPSATREFEPALPGR
jgi:hypothetical protein